MSIKDKAEPPFGKGGQGGFTVFISSPITIYYKFYLYNLERLCYFTI